MAFTKIVNTGIGTLTNLAVPKGTTADRPVGINSGVIFYNTSTDKFEGYGASWGSLGGGAGGSGQNSVFFENDTNVTNDYTITSGKNAMSAGPITLDASVQVTIPAGSVWTVV